MKKVDKGIYIKDIVPGTRITGVFCVGAKNLLKKKDGSPFVGITLVDSSGQIEARIWDNAKRHFETFNKGDFISIEAEAVEFNQKIQLKINGLSQVPGEGVDISHFLPTSPCDLDKAWNKVERAIKEIKDASLRVLLTNIFKDTGIKKAFKSAPAAKRLHHAYIGGLLEHVANLLDLVKLVVKKYSHLKKDILVAASILHDIGKIRELAWDIPPIDYTDEGRLLGHINIGIEIIDKSLREIGLNENTGSILILKHIILSHHGQREYGSPVLPMTEEAMVFHLLDDMDAKLNFLSGLKDTAKENEQGYRWSDYQRLFERYFYLPPEAQELLEKEKVHSEDKKEEPSQPGLWDLI